MNRGDIFNSVRKVCNRPNMPDEDLSLMMDMIEGEFNMLLRDHPRNVRRTDYTIPTEDEAGNPYTEDTPIIPLPTDLAKIRTVSNPDEEPYDQWPSFAKCVVNTKGYIERGDCVQVYPTPARGDTVYLDYVAFIEPLLGDADTNWISKYYSHLYIWGMLSIVSIYVKDVVNNPIWEKKYNIAIAAIEIQGIAQNYGATPRQRNVG